MNPLVVLQEADVIRLQKAVDCQLETVVWLGDWLAHLNLFSDAQIYDILRFVKPRIIQLEQEVQAGSSSAVTLAICDYRWVSCSGIDNFLDVQVTEQIEKLDDFAVTHIMCDVISLRSRMQYRQGRFNADRENSQPAPPQSL